VIESCEPAQVIKVLEEASILNRQDTLREGHIIQLPAYGQVVMTGDFHGCHENFRKLQRFADLEHCLHRHIIIHELIHSNDLYVLDADQNRGEDCSCMLLFQAAKWKIEYPEQVHFMMGNHDLAQITSREITKGGMASIANFNKWVIFRFGPQEGEAIIESVRKFLLTLPLAARCPNRIWLSHSLPGPAAMDTFDFSVFGREWQPEDLVPRGSVYETVWGRNHPPEQLTELASLLNVSFFVLGHQRQELGYDAQANRLIILASDHGQGSFLPIDLSKKYSFSELVDRIKYFYDLPDAVA
jgi:hypothetical protein